MPGKEGICKYQEKEIQNHIMRTIYWQNQSMKKGVVHMECSIYGT